ncbi:MAG: DUF2834 domain-containing protein [Myxococcota bacterium]
MHERFFRGTILAVAAAFSAYFAAVVIPPLIQNPDVIGALKAGFVNPYSSGYSADIFGCWAILAAWVTYEAKAYSVRRGWICLILGFVPGVAVGFAAYLIVRSNQIEVVASSADSPDAV